MKNRQFIILCILIIVGFSILYYQNDRNQNISSLENNIEWIKTTTDWIGNSIWRIEYSIDDLCPSHWPIND